MELLQTHRSQRLQIPCRTTVRTDRKLPFDFLTLTHHLVSKHIVGMIFRKVFYIGKICNSIICIKIQQNTAFPKYTEPLLISVTYMRQCPGKISGDDNIKCIIRKLRIFGIHDCKFTVCPFFLCQNTGIFDHIRCQIDTCHLMASLCQKNRKKSCSTSNVQDAKLFIIIRKLCLNLLHPAVRHRTVKLRTPLFQKAVAAFFPVVNDTLFALIIAAYNTSISHHRTISNHLQRARLIQDHPVKLRLTDFLNLAFIVTDFTQDIALLDHVTNLFKRIPEPVFFRILIAHIRYLERIIRTKILQSLIDSHVTQNIPDVSSSRTDLLIIPVAHAATLDQDTRDSLRSRIIIRTTRSHVGLYHIWHIHLLRHLTRNLNHILRCSSRIIHIRSQLLIIISTVQINIKISHRLQLLRNRPCQTLHLRTIRVSRKFTVQVLCIRQPHTSITRLKSRTVQHLHDNDRTSDLLNLKLL